MSDEDDGLNPFARWGFRNFVDGVKDLILCVGVKRRCLFMVIQFLKEKRKDENAYRFVEK